MILTVAIGKVEIPIYWLLLTAGTVGMLICIWKRRERFSLNASQCMIFTVLLTVVGVAGAKLLFILENMQHVRHYGVSMAGGVSFFGSVYLIPLLMPVIGLLFRLKVGQTMDICGPCVAIMIGCMRFGCFIQDCCGGWLAQIGDISFHWPTQAVESIGDFLILLWLLELEKAGKYKGQLYPTFMVLYSVMRFFIEFFRDTTKDWFWMSHGQWFSIVAVMVGFIWIYVMKNIQKNLSRNKEVI